MVGWSRLVPAALLAALVAVVAAPGARADGTDVLVYSNGTNVQPGDQIISGGTIALTPSGRDSRTCSVSLQSTVRTNPRTPGTATTSIGIFDLSGCDASFVDLPYDMSIGDGSGFPVAIRSPAGVEIRIGIDTPLGRRFCEYGAPMLAGGYSNDANRATFQATTFTPVAQNDAPCVRSLTVSGSIRPLVGAANGTGGVLVS